MKKVLAKSCREGWLWKAQHFALQSALPYLPRVLKPGSLCRALLLFAYHDWCDILVCPVDPLPLKKTCARVRRDAAVVLFCHLRSIVMGIIHDTGLSASRSGASWCSGSDASRMYRTCQWLGRSEKPQRMWISINSFVFSDTSICWYLEFVCGGLRCCFSFRHHTREWGTYMQKRKNLNVCTG